MMKTVIARTANSADLEALYGLRDEATVWMQAAGIEQWPSNMRSYGHAILREHVQRGGAYVFLAAEGQVIATATLGGPDPDYWGPDLDLEAGLHVYKVIVARAWSGIGLGEAILDWAGMKAEEAGKKWLRLDCRRDNQRLHDYYRHRGFQLIRMAPPVPGRYSGALFERPAAYRTSPTGIEITEADKDQ